ncbi:MAG: hypothetical protein JSS83_02885 [Cyanobacteria bacterium SZAS LIN-3]|nr:hypothetical protein [Cyanobacteria bacterium SZAS LIN-3]
MSNPTVTDRAIFAGAALFFLLALFLWWHFDHSYPFWDGAAHVKDSMAYARLLKHAHIFKPEWIKQFLTVNYDYPLTIHAINGTFKAILGMGRISDMAALIFYELILILSIYRLSLTLLKDRLAAALSIVLICSYPLVAILSHVPLLETGYLAFTTLGLWGIALFNEKPGWKSAAIMGLTLALGSTSKQIAVLFLIAPCLVLLFKALKSRNWQAVGQLTLAAAFPAAALLIWIVPNHKALAAWRDYYKDDPTLQGGFFNVLMDHLRHYLLGMPSMLSPTLGLLALAALVYLFAKNKDQLLALAMPICSAAFGLVLISCVAVNRPEQRYVIPVAIAAALLSSALLSSWLKSSSKALKAAAAALLVFAMLQFVLLNFTPYPIAASQSFVETINKIAGHNMSQELVEPRCAPTPPGDKWGQEWAVAEIDKVEKGRKTTLNIMPSTPDLSVHTIDLVCIFAGTQIEPSTFRQFTLHGDIVRYDEEAIKYYQWYLLKTGYQGTAQDSKESAQNYQNILHYVENPEHYQLVGERDLPDGSKLRLYHQIKHQ